jgi:hypothetical protein
MSSESIERFSLYRGTLTQNARDGEYVRYLDHERGVLSQIKIARDQALCDAIKEVEKMRDENNRSYEYWKSISSNPDTDFGVLKFIAWAGEDERVITALISLGPQRED